LQPQAEEAVAADLEHLGAVGPAVAGGDIPGLVLEEGRVGAEHLPEVVQPPA
jgi:hypothetical protein